MFRRVMLLGLVVLVAGISFRQTTTVGHAVVPINFTVGTITGSGFATVNPTSLEVGPDGRLYVADGGSQGGRIQALTLNPTTKAVTAVQQVTTSTQLLEVYGIAFDPSESSIIPPPIYVTNTISGFGDALEPPPPGMPGAYPGKITRISGTGYTTRQDIITGLPASNSGHQANGLAFAPAPDGRLYIAQGSTTNAGVINGAGGSLFQRNEVPTSAAILVADIHDGGFDGNITYNPPNDYTVQVQKVSGDVDIYAYGLRNPYDLVFHSNGILYNTDNGPNDGFGFGSQTCSTDDGVHAQAPDELNIIYAGKYYGHPNRNRGMQIPDALQCDYKAGTEPSSGNYEAPIGLLPASSDGLAEYKSSVFGGQMQGDLLYVSWVENTLRRVKLSPDGLSVVSDVILYQFPSVPQPSAPLDVAVGTDGTIYVAEWGTSKITYLKPDLTPATDITVTSITPPGGPVTGGQTVTITGTNFTTTAETTADIGGAPLTNLVVHNSTMLTGVTSPTVSGTGLKNVNVQVMGLGSDTLTNAYNYTLGGGTTPPIADAGPDWNGPIAHIDHAHVTLDARNSTDPDGFIVSYEWREGPTVLSTNSVDSKQFTLGEHFVTLTVTDNDNYTDTDTVRILVTQFAENPEPYFCFDVNGDEVVNVIDLHNVALSFQKNFYSHNGQFNGYSRMRDWNADRYINVIDLFGTAQDFTPMGQECSPVDKEIRAATVYMEQFQNINAAIAAGYVQVTPYIPGQGRHMVQGTVAGQDTIFEPGHPESLLYEPDASMPGGWRLGGAMYIIPINLSPLPPDGFATLDDAWHYHNDLCLWNNFASVAEGVSQSDCMSRPGNPIWIPQAGWLVHLWNYVPNPQGRFVEINAGF